MHILFFLSGVAMFAVAAISYFAGFSVVAVAGLLVFAALHSVAVAYGKYEYVPIGDTIGKWFGSERNLYDRLVHGAFGLLYSPLFFELAERAGLSGVPQLLTPIILVMAASALFEITEWLGHIARIKGMGPEAQGDPWDAQKDTLVALIGSIVFVGVYVVADKL